MKFLVLYPYNKLQEFLNRGHERSVLAKKNISASLLLKGLDVGIGFLMVPLILNYLDQTRYGIWLTMTSLVAWFGFMDIGLGNGLRNKFAEAKANGNDEEVRTYVSTTYAILTIVTLIFIALFLIINNFIPWYKVLNVEVELNTDLSLLALIVFVAFGVRFVSKLITTIVTADQKPALRDAINLAGKFLVLIAVFLLTKAATSSLLYLGLAYTGLPVIAMILISFYFFSNDYKDYSPSWSFVDLSYAKDLFGLGWKFFVIQISVMVLFMTDNIIISQLFGPQEVTPYQIVNKYYSVILMVFLILISPMWSAYTEAYEKGDVAWIKQSISKQIKIWYWIIITVLCMTLFSNFIYKIWVGERIHINILLSISWGIFIVLQSYNSIQTSFLNGVGKIKMQMITAIFSIIVNIPMSIFLAKYINLGLSGVILATNISILIYVITRKIQVDKIINDKAEGIWNK